MYNSIINPKTSRKVSIYGKMGRKILMNYINQIGGATSSLQSPPPGERITERTNLVTLKYEPDKEKIRKRNLLKRVTERKLKIPTKCLMGIFFS